jgi:hypothetical protein
MSMERAYRVADELLKDRLRAHAPEALDEIEQVTEEDVLVTTGCYDWIQNVFTHGGIGHRTVSPAALERIALDPDQVVFVNCPGEFSRKGVRRLRQFVHDGGFLFTTDWALKNVVEPAFPGFIEYNGTPTTDDVVQVEFADTGDPFLSSIVGPDDEPQWWLEGSSYPIRILRRDAVQVLIRSRELEQKYGEAPVLVAFDFGSGRVYHMISHFYLQRTETRTIRQRASSMEYLREKGVDEATWGKYEAMGAGSTTLGSVESALMSQGTMKSILHQRMRRRKKGDAAETPGESG